MDRYVFLIFSPYVNDWTSFPGQEIRIISEIITPRDVAKAFSEASGIDISLTEVNREQFDALEHADPPVHVWAK